jgi:hypothetical protein
VLAEPFNKVGRYSGYEAQKVLPDQIEISCVADVFE